MKTLYVLLLLLFLNISLRAQVAIEWQKTIGGSGVDRLNTIVQTSDGGYICGGISNSNISGDKTENSQGTYDYWVVKLDMEGNIQWQKTIGGNGEDRLHCIQQTSDGGSICGGWSNSNISGNKTADCQGGFDYWVVKLDEVGNIQWQNTIGGSDNDYLRSIAQTSDGGYICGGFSSSNISGDKTENSRGYSDYWVVKLDGAGNIQWQKTIGGFSLDDLTSIAQTSDGGYICGGESHSSISGDKTENSLGYSDFWVVKLDVTGNIQWQNTIGGDGTDALFGISQTPDGGYICGGYSNSDISWDKTENSKGSHDFWVVKLDDAGDILWQVTIGGSGPDMLYSIAQTAEGGYICGGESRSNVSGDKTENCKGYSDYWVVMLDPAGNIQWQNTIGGSVDDILSTIVQTIDGGYICGGWSYSGISGDKTEVNQGDYDYWVVKLTSNFNSIHGKTFADLNNNSLHDTGEPQLQGIMVTESNTGAIGISGNNGNYNVAVFDTGNFTVYPALLLTHYTAAPISHSVYFSTMHQTDSLNDFAFQPNGTINDLQINITPTTPFRPGFNGHYNLHYKNVGTTSHTGTVVFYPDANVTYVSSSATPSLITLDSIVWQTALLNPFDAGNILVTVNVNVAAPLNSLVNSCAKIEPLAGDATPGNNLACWEVIVTGSYDPNDILVDRATITTTELVSPPYLEYIIRFQNTGTDTAFTVKVLNPIDTTMLQLQTFELVSLSHPANATWKSWERNMEFQFDNILLPDSNINEPLSHGFIRYRIKPKSTLAVGNQITNNAHIYFDFNNPIATNIAITEVVLNTVVNSVDDSVDFSIYPNPTNNDVTVAFTLKRDGEVELNVFNAMGQVVTSSTGKFSSGKYEFNISASELPSGIYFIKVSVEGIVVVKKMVKM